MSSCDDDSVVLLGELSLFGGQAQGYRRSSLAGSSSGAPLRLNTAGWARATQRAIDGEMAWRKAQQAQVVVQSRQSQSTSPERTDLADARVN